MVELNTLFGLAETLAIIVGVVIALQQLRNIKITRQTELLMQYYQRLVSEEYMKIYDEITTEWDWTDFDDFLAKYGPEDNPDAWMKFRRTVSTLEVMGLLVRDGVFDPRLVWHWAGGRVVRLWVKMEPVIFEYREKIASGMWLEWFEDFYYTLLEIRGEDRILFKERHARRMAQREKLGLP
jgi:hypothetical protein